MPTLENARHEKFAQLVAAGGTYADSWLEACPNSRATRKSAEQSAARNVKQYPEIAERIAELKANLEAKGLITREELLAFYVDVLKASPSEASKESPLCELKMSKAGEYYAFPCKMKAADSIKKMLGWDEPEKIEHGVSDPLADLMKRLRGADTE